MERKRKKLCGIFLGDSRVLCREVGQHEDLGYLRKKEDKRRGRTGAEELWIEIKKYTYLFSRSLKLQ